VHRSRTWRIVGAVLLTSAAAVALWAQLAGPGQAQQAEGGRRQPRQQGENGAEEATEEEKVPPLPTDPRLLQLHRDFVVRAEKLATEYEQKKELDKARVVYEEILKLVPKHPKAVQALEKLNQQELTAERKVIEVFATKGLQETGVYVAAGKPVHITVTGTWTLNISHTLGPKGMEIPEELRGFNLGSLVGGVDTGNPEEFKPVLIGGDYEFIAEQTGQLVLGMWDSDHQDNSGKLSVTIQGTFRKR
jgi:hypothetical protein